jgi:hypothetical protein
MGKDSKQHQKKKKISYKPVKKERKNNHSKDKDLGAQGIRVEYHSEAAKMPKYEEVEDMKMGYHSEAANISSHRDRLHDNKDSLTEQKVDDDDNDASDQ